MNLLSLCSGIGGLDLAVETYFGATTVAYSEVDEHASTIMERHWPGVPNVGDLKVADWEALGDIDILCGGIPCQPWSTAGKLGRTEDDRHLWPYVADAVRVLRPRYVVLENVAGFYAAGGLDAVLADLCALGFDASWCSVRASDVGAPHRRERVFLLAWDAESAVSAGSQHERMASGDWATEPRESVGEDGLLPTPTAGDGIRTSNTYGNGNLTLVGALLPTPRVGGMSNGPSQAELDAGNPKHRLETVTNWGDFAVAIERWGRVIGREAPSPLEGKRLSPDFVEWMMGYDEGWTEGLTRKGRLKCLGNAVVTRQALFALSQLTVRASEAA